MQKHEETYCPKCNAGFICKTGDIINCQCATVALSEETKKFLAKTTFDCLCKNCLAKTQQEVKNASRYQFPTHKVMLIEDLHFYMEGNYCVFTELYHMLRGYCCKNGCRHCPYGMSVEAKKP